MTVVLNKLDSDFDDRLPAWGGAVLIVGFGKFVSDFDDRLPIEENLSLLLVDKPKVSEV